MLVLEPDPLHGEEVGTRPFGEEVSSRPCKGSGSETSVMYYPNMHARVSLARWTLNETDKLQNVR